MSNFNGLLVGTDAIDLSRVSGLGLHRSPYRQGDIADTSWGVADCCISEGLATPEDYLMDMDSLDPIEAGSAILSLIGLLKAVP